MQCADCMLFHRRCYTKLPIQLLTTLIICVNITSGSFKGCKCMLGKEKCLNLYLARKLNNKINTPPPSSTKKNSLFKGKCLSLPLAKRMINRESKRLFGDG